jgi:hypothetical protein
MKSRNQFRSTAFLKIKHTIQSCTDSGHLITARQMLENATPICSKDELAILRDYLLEKWDEINPVGDNNCGTGESFADQMDSIGHKRLSA